MPERARGHARFGLDPLGRESRDEPPEQLRGVVDALRGGRTARQHRHRLASDAVLQWPFILFPLEGQVKFVIQILNGKPTASTKSRSPTCGVNNILGTCFDL